METERNDFAEDVFGDLHDLLDEIRAEQEVDLEKLQGILTRFPEVAGQYYELLTEIEVAARKTVSRERMRDIYPVITEALGRDGLGHGVMYRAKKHGASLEGVASFRSSVSLMARRRQLSRHFGPETFVTDKLRGEKFARNLGLPTALAYDEVFTAETLPIVPGTVIKPRGELGSRGVFILGEDSTIYDVQKSQYVGDEEQVREIIAALVTDEPSEKLRGRGRVGRDEWIVERAIFDSQDGSLPARDLKFFVFYGKVAAVLEIMRFPEKRYCWWDAYGNRVKTGIYDEYDWAGEGVTDAELAVAASVSSEIPGPFMRLDFLRGRDGLILGEFSGGVGEYHKFNTRWDQHLGELFLDAEGRLTSDLLTGKRFEAYSEFSDAHYRHYPAIHDQRYLLSVKSPLPSVAREVEDFCRSSAIRGYVSRSGTAEDKLEVVARTGLRRLERLEQHFREMELAGSVDKAEKVPYYGAFPGQLLFQNSVR